MSGHDRFREMLARRSELTPEEEGRLQQHLEGCPQCRDTAEAYAHQTQLLRSLPLAEPSPALRAGVFQSIREAPARRARVWRRGLLLAAPLAAALALIALVTLHSPHRSSTTAFSHPPTPTPTAAAPPTAAPPTPAPLRPVTASGHRPPARHTVRRRSFTRPVRQLPPPTAALVSPPVVSQLLASTSTPQPTLSARPPATQPAPASRPSPVKSTSTPKRGPPVPAPPVPTRGASVSSTHPSNGLPSGAVLVEAPVTPSPPAAASPVATSPATPPAASSPPAPQPPTPQPTAAAVSIHPVAPTPIPPPVPPPVPSPTP
jgi:hypothetical protein